jgi:hypothetical protein
MTTASGGLLNSDLRANGWRKLVPADGVVTAEMMIETIAEVYDLDDYIADRLEFSYRSYDGQKGQEKIVRYTDHSVIPSGTRRHEPTGHEQIPVTLDDVILQVRYKAGDIVEEDVSCDSEFMLGVMDRVGIALRAAFPWVKPEELIYLVMDNAGGHGTDVAWETYTADLEEKHKVRIIRQCPRSPETNLLDLGIWMSIQAAVEKEMYMKRGDIHALAVAVKNAWETRLSENAFKNVYERLQNVLVMIDEDKGGNAKVEAKRGKLFRKLELRDDDSESDVDED